MIIIIIMSPSLHTKCRESGAERTFFWFTAQIDHNDIFEQGFFGRHGFLRPFPFDEHPRCRLFQSCLAAQLEVCSRNE